MEFASRTIATTFKSWKLNHPGKEGALAPDRVGFVCQLCARHMLSHSEGIEQDHCHDFHVMETEPPRQMKGGFSPGSRGVEIPRRGLVVNHPRAVQWTLRERGCGYNITLFQYPPNKPSGTLVPHQKTASSLGVKTPDVFELFL